MVLTVTSMVPSTQRLGEDVTATIRGSDFNEPLEVFVDTLTPVRLLQVVFKSSTSLQVVIPTGIERGVYNVRVRLNDGTEAVLRNGLVVIPPVPAMPFANENFKTIMNRMLQRMSSKYDKREGSTIWDMLAPVAAEIENEYVSMNEVLQASFLGTSYGTYLDLVGLDHGVYRFQPNKSTVTLKFTASSAITIPKAFRVSTGDPNPLIFITDDEVGPFKLVNSVYVGEVKATSQLQGSKYNVLPNTITTLIGSLTDLDTVTNELAATGGRDEEPDGSYKSRIIRRVREPSHGGNQSDYILWAQDVPGVGKVSIQPLINGAGTVGVHILDNEDGIPTTSLVNAVQNYIDPEDVRGMGEGTAPIGARAFVQSATLALINVRVSIALSSGAIGSEVTEAIKNNLTEYMKTLEIGEKVIYFSIASVIQNTTGVDTITVLQLQQGNGRRVTTDIAMLPQQKAIANTITVTIVS